MSPLKMVSASTLFFTIANLARVFAQGKTEDTSIAQTHSNGQARAVSCKDLDREEAIRFSPTELCLSVLSEVTCPEDSAATNNILVGPGD